MEKGHDQKGYVATPCLEGMTLLDPEYSRGKGICGEK